MVEQNLGRLLASGIIAGVYNIVGADVTPVNITDIPAPCLWASMKPLLPGQVAGRQMLSGDENLGVEYLDAVDYVSGHKFLQTRGSFRISPRSIASDCFFTGLFAFATQPEGEYEEAQTSGRL